MAELHLITVIGSFLGFTSKMTPGPHWPPMSQWVKLLVPQWGIKPQSFAFRASVITTRPPRHHYIRAATAARKQSPMPHSMPEGSK